MNLTVLAIRKNRVTAAVLAIIFISGLFAYRNFPRSEDPVITIRTAVVKTLFPGASPERMENLITDKLEKKIQEIPEVDHITSENRTGVSIIYVEMKERYKDMDPLWDDLKDKVEQAAKELPEGASKPFVWDDFGDVYGIVFGLTGDGFGYRELKDVADDLKRELLLVPDVARVELYGIQDERIFIEISNARLSALGLTPAQVYQQVADQNIVLPGGSVDVGPEKVVIEPTGDYGSVDQIRRTIISVPGSGDVVYLGDIARIRRATVDPPETIVRFMGEDALAVAVNMAEGGNIVDLGERVSRFAAQYGQTLPVGINIETINYQPAKVTKATDDFMLNLLQAILIVCLVMFLSLGLRTGLVVASLIPMAILLTFVLMQCFGIQLQRVSIASLIIALGLMVDCGIVMSESILVRLEKGEPPMEACVVSARQLMVPLLTSTLTTSAAFLPIALAKSVVGEYCLSLFQVVSLALLSSWVLGLLMIPFFCFYVLRIKPRQGGIFKKRTVRAVLIALLYAVCLFVAKIPALIMIILAPFCYVVYLKPKQTQSGAESAARFYGAYERLLGWVLERRRAFLLSMVLCFVLAIFGFGFVKKIFFPPSDRPQFTVGFWMPEGTRIGATSEEVKKLERFLRAQDAVENFVTYVGEGGPRFYLGLSPEQNNENYAFVLVNCRFFGDVVPLMVKTRSFLEEHTPYADPLVKRLESGKTVGDPVQVRVSGHDLAELDRLASQVKKVLEAVPGTVTVRDNWGTKVKKLSVKVNQSKAKRIGISSRDIAYSLTMQYDGQEITQYREDDEVIPVVVRSDDAARKDIGKIEGLSVYSFTGRENIPLSQLAQTELGWQRAKILRRDRLRTITVSSQVREGYYAADIFKVLIPRLETLSQSWPPGYKFETGGQEEESKEANKSIMDQFPVALFLIVLLMIMQFNSLRRAAIIMLTIPLSIIGVTAGLLLTGKPFGFMAMLGLISLAGVVINNAIVLIDKIELEKEAGARPMEAVLKASVSRFRPIVLTTLTTMGGLLPLAVFGAEFWSPMAVTILSGLAFATVLTLGFVPALYSVLFKIRR